MVKNWLCDTCQIVFAFSPKFFLTNSQNPFAEILLLKTAKHSRKSPLNFIMEEQMQDFDRINV